MVTVNRCLNSTGSTGSPWCVQYLSVISLPWISLTLSLKVSVSCSLVSDSLQPHGLKLTRLLCSWNSPCKDTGVGSHSLLQGVFLTQGLNLGLLHYRQILYHLRYQRSPLSNLSISIKCSNTAGIKARGQRLLFAWDLRPIH